MPDSVTEVDDWAFYDLNTAVILSFANPNVSISEGAFQSSGNAALYLPQGTTQTSAGGNTSDVSFANNTVTFTGDNYVPKAQTIEIFKDFANDVSADELNKTFRSLTKDEAAALNNAIAEDSSYSQVKSLFNFKEGYYINGNKVSLDENIAAYDVKTGEKISVNEETGKLSSTSNSYYKYAAYRDNDNDGDIDILYYSPYSITYSYNPVTISSDNTNLNAKSTSVGNWGKMSYESGLSSYNVEIVMEWGMNALLYATNGGKVNNLSYTNGSGQVSSLSGNYYGAESNFGITASFDKTSTWTVTKYILI